MNKPLAAVCLAASFAAGVTMSSRKIDEQTHVEESRSPKWSAVRDAFLKDHPACEVCGGKHDLQVHHRKPFHLYPKMELDQANLITLCRRHHFLQGHLELFDSYNPWIDEDVERWKKRLSERPK